jgi:hypothetical protein
MVPYQTEPQQLTAVPCAVPYGQEEVVIELVLKLVAEKFVRGEGKMTLPFGMKLPFT